jgi:hypothetical protein
MIHTSRCDSQLKFRGMPAMYRRTRSECVNDASYSQHFVTLYEAGILTFAEKIKSIHPA